MSEVKISYKEAFTKMAAFIKTALSFEPAAAPAPAAVSVDYPIADGRVLTIDKLDHAYLRSPFTGGCWV